jgi:hypothetical protein
MMKKRFCCDASREMYEDYYMQQGRGVPVFQGSRGQRGHGLGSMLSGLFRSAMPMIRRGLAVFGKHALKTGAQIATDVSEGRSLKESAMSRLPEGIKRMATSGDFSMQSGSGKRKRSIKPRSKLKKKDIFG